MYFSQFWRLKAQDQGARMVTFRWEFFLWVLEERLLTVSSHSKDRAGSFVSYRDALPIMKPLSLNAITLRIRVST